MVCFTGPSLVLFFLSYLHDDVIKWKHFPRYWPFVRGIHRLPVNSLHKGKWRGAMMFSLICAWISGWINNDEAGDLRRHRVHYDVTVMLKSSHCKSHEDQTPVDLRLPNLHMSCRLDYVTLCQDSCHWAACTITKGQLSVTFHVKNNIFPLYHMDLCLWVSRMLSPACPYRICWPALMLGYMYDMVKLLRLKRGDILNISHGHAVWLYNGIIALIQCRS